MLPNLLDHDNTNNSIKIATILLGSNDSVSPSLDKRHIPIAQYEDCMEKIVQELERRGIQYVILITPPPVDIKHWTDYSFETRGWFSNFFVYSDSFSILKSLCVFSFKVNQ